jgi:hypothetical protein
LSRCMLARETVGVKHFNELLLLLHAVGLELEKSERASEQVWGRHLLEDWRSLELLAQSRDTEPPSESVALPDLIVVGQELRDR